MTEAERIEQALLEDSEYISVSRSEIAALIKSQAAEIEQLRGDYDGDMNLFDEAADTIDALVQEVERLKQEQAEPLTDGQIDDIAGAAFDDHAWRGTTILNREVARAVERAHKIGVTE